ncbi:MAG: hypothetical protein ACYTF1_00625 [Planctomycetota bacterium]
MIKHQITGNRKHLLYAFTLVEVLVVCGIILLLFVILLPSLRQARRQARAVMCQSCLGQWGNIWSMYCQMNKNSFTDGVYEGTGFHRGGWIMCLRPLYDTKSDILRCPMATERHPNGVDYGGPYNTYVMPSDIFSKKGGDEECSYGVNTWVCNPPPEFEEIQGRPTKYNWRRTTKVKRPHLVPVFADTMWRGGGPTEFGRRGDPPTYDGQWIGPHSEMNHFCINRHNGYVNHLFMDWSVRRVGLRELWKLKWHQEFNTAGRWTRAGRDHRYPWPKWLRRFPEH